MAPRIGTAGWSIPRAIASEFAPDGPALERYATRFDAAEINSSFYRSHRQSTWERWAASVPPDFRFSVKLPRTITHQQALRGCDELLDRFIAEVSALGSKLGPLLLQLPPKLAYDPAAAESFFAALKARTGAPIACEPRNPSWFSAAADERLESLQVARVAADPFCCDTADVPGGWRGLIYWRLHGSPLKYRSSYADRIGHYAREIACEAERAETWCIFDNTASSAAASDALALVAATKIAAADQGLERL